MELSIVSTIYSVLLSSLVVCQVPPNVPQPGSWRGWGPPRPVGYQGGVPYVNAPGYSAGYPGAYICRGCAFDSTYLGGYAGGRPCCGCSGGPPLPGCWPCRWCTDTPQGGYYLNPGYISPYCNTTILVLANATIPSIYNITPVTLPENSTLWPDGIITFPNATILLTRYSCGIVPPAARLPSGILRFANGTSLPAGTKTLFPPPGVPLNATAETLIYPPVYLPKGTTVLFNGTLQPPGLAKIPTFFIRGIIPNCGGILCHHARLT